MSTRKILYVRSGPYKVNLNGYNLQEIGLGKAFCKKGYDFDILYYSDENKIELIDTPQNNLRILWCKGIRLLRSGVYPKILKKEFLKKYDYIIVSEYSQIMAVLLSGLHSNVYVYNGPYYNLFKLKLIEPIYDKLFVSVLNKRLKKIFCKTKMAENFLEKKGFSNTIPVGVGLDLEKYKKEEKIDVSTKTVLNKMQGHKNILFVGSISKRKNVEFIIEAFIDYKIKNRQDRKTQLILIGKGSNRYKQYCKNLIPQELQESVLWVESLRNSQLKFVYQKTDLFLLPSKQEIFGMVLLEAMYFSVPVIASHTAGADMLIKTLTNGIIMDNYDYTLWSEQIKQLLNNTNLAKSMGENAHKTVSNEFNWNRIANKMEESFQ
ncbi:glycosyltransferase family 4 protein [Limosilactobacillus reuteri]|uniref:glycosyltransferase family 4 protein n=1 Tax=Limosilactobacillus reuteri TaxID=1598 RepID=UPI003D070832